MTNTDEHRREVLQSAHSMPSDCPRQVEYTGPSMPGLYHNEYLEVLGIIPSLTKYTTVGDYWTCDTYYLRDDTGGCIVAPCSWFVARD